MKDTCWQCCGELKGDIVAMHGRLFCSSECAVEYTIECALRDVVKNAMQTVEDDSEIIRLGDII